MYWVLSWKKVLIQATTYMSLENTMFKWKKPNITDHRLYESIEVKFSEYKDLRTCQSRKEGEVEHVLVVCRVSIHSDEGILELGRGSGCKILWLRWLLQNYSHLKSFYYLNITSIFKNTKKIKYFYLLWIYLYFVLLMGSFLCF